MSTIGHKSMVIFFSQWSSYALLLASSVVVARVLGPENVGRMAFSFSAIGILFTITSLGLAQTHQKRLAEGMDFGLCFGTFSSIMLVLNLIAVGIGLCLLAAIKPLAATASSPSVFILFMAYQSLTCLGQIFTYGFYGQQQFVKAAFTSLSARVVRLIGVSTILVAWPTLTSLAICFLIEGCAFIGMGTFLSGVLREIKRPTRASLRSYWEYAKPLAFTSPLGVVTENLDRLMLGARYTIHEVGGYSIALNMFEAIKSLPAAVVTATFPQFTSEFVTKGAESMRGIFYSAQRKLLIIATAAAVLGIVWSSDVMAIFYGESFRFAGPALAIFFGLFWFICFSNPYHYVLYATEKHRLFMWLTPLCTGLYALSLWLLCQKNVGLGGIGAAVSLWIPPVLSFPFVLSRTSKLYRISVARNVVSFVAAGAVMFAVCKLFFMSGGWLMKAAGTLLSLVAYVGALYLQKEVGPDDIHYFLYVCNPVHVIRYLRNDFFSRKQPC